MSLEFSSKARTLESLSGVIKTAKVAPLLIVKVRDWEQHRGKFLPLISEEWGSEPLIVRSSCVSEDLEQASNAGAFLSILNVELDNLERAIDEVIASYSTKDVEDEVLIQPMLNNVLMSGVAFSHDPNTSSPYRIINWSEGSDTAAVTGGLGGEMLQQAADAPRELWPEKLSPVLTLVEELLELFDQKPIDCEFAFTQYGSELELWCLQVRPLVLSHEPESREQQTKRLQSIAQKISVGMRPHPFLMGSSTIYGVMPDWNPAEILGIRPKPLALSLYRDLITDAIWAYQRNNYGYRNLRSFPLMPQFHGLPYIDVRLSFNSFIPADLDEKIGGRLADHYVSLLQEDPALHDKVEFEIVYSCYTLDLVERLKKLGEVGFSEEDQGAIANSLRHLTNKIVHHDTGLWRGDAQKLNILNERRERISSSSLTPVEKIYWLLEDTKRYGTLPFAGLARAGFIAVQMLKSMVSMGVLSQDDHDAFIGSISTVSSQLARDRVSLDKTSFLARYGHLRPGTYDILSARYDENPDQYFNWNDRASAVSSSESFSLTLPQMREIKSLLQHHCLEANPVSLFDFMQAGIELRELAKFHFTHNLSDAMVLMGEVGREYDVDREDLAFCSSSVFREMYTTETDAKSLLLNSIEEGKEKYEKALRTALPPIITKPEDVWSFIWPKTQPNFITQKQVTSRVVGCEQKDVLEDAIVCIPNADPGFDWLFAYPIAGLITAWGGANSHMAIRAGELGLPAVIGAGETLFRAWSGARLLHIDCAGRRVSVLD